MRACFLVRAAVVASLLLFGFPLMGSAQVNDASAGLSAERMRNSYEIYSLLVPGDVLANMDSSRTQRWAIAEETIGAQDINPALAPEAMLQAPPDHPKRFKEAVADYNLHKDQRVTLTRSFQLDRPYTLLDTSEVDEFRSVLGGVSSPSALRQKYAGYPGITYFSRVYFDTHQTAALVYMLDWCGNMCAQAEWVYLEKEKKNGKWVRRSGRGAS
jgi:hypothetical protein